MTPMVKIMIALFLNIAIAVYTIIITRKSALPDSTKTLLYVFSILMPIVGLILYAVVSRKEVRS